MKDQNETTTPEAAPESGGSAGAALLGSPVGMISNGLIPITDDIDERLEELAAVAAAWQKNRDRNRASPMLRKALIMCAEELTERMRMKIVAS